LIRHGSVEWNSKIIESDVYLKSQIPSTKFQINLKFQFPMTKTFIAVVSHRCTNFRLSNILQFGTNVGGSAVWNFEFDSLRFVWDLSFGAWNFRDSYWATNRCIFSQLHVLQPSFFYPMTGHLGSGVKIDEFRDFTDAALIGIEAAAVENATGGKVDGGGNLTF